MTALDTDTISEAMAASLVLEFLDFDPPCGSPKCEAAATWSVTRLHLMGSLCGHGLLCDKHWTEYKKYEDIVFTAQLVLPNGIAPLCMTHQLMVKRVEGKRF